MAEPFISEIRMFGFNFAPRGWAFCNGQLLPIAQNQALFSLLGTTYGGDGRTTFALPNLQSRVPVGFGNSNVGGFYALGQTGGQETVTLPQSEIPAHTHAWNASSDNADARLPQGRFLAAVPTDEDAIYVASGSLVQMDPRGVTLTGGSQPHENRQPSLALNFCIALVGVFPSRN